MTLRISQCPFCRHYRPEEFGPRGQAVCDAFPGGIPRPILYGGADHRHPYDGDHGIRFERSPDVDPNLFPTLLADLDVPVT